MAKPTFLLAVIFLILLGGCKKDNTQQFNLIEFDLNGVHHKLSIADAILEVDDSPPAVGKALNLFSSGSSLPIAGITIYENTSAHSSDLINTGIYTDVFSNPDCVGDSGVCNTFSFGYTDTINGLLIMPDSGAAGVMNITSCQGSPPVINGTFSCDITDAYGATGQVWHVTNGQIKNVTYYRQ